ncbi:YigZ family protein [Clostridium formicaceticum]|uniref:IMPACT family member YigZ n=1 Tax=Clostridium formicaceticum TaxID=1497 RepID=A0AAC9RHV4_9CLOT|nr:YigZ family protein [Clostridium formicaceticum]AOY76819.1 YigZ family protein [Clostridium formicaceticum]ARE87289.1 IMPACT family member YigZ [Clostridium formicaceticum]
MLKEYRTIYEAGVKEIVIEKSRFIGYAKPIISEEEAVQFIGEIKAKHKDATHNVPAYVVGGNNEIQRYSDDGEPSGTAGIPVLEVIKKENLRNVAVVVTRYFGGVKLGAGGLVRAYTKGAKIALDDGKIVTKRLYRRIHIKIDYTLLGKVQNEILQKGYLLQNTEYDDAVHFFVYILLDEVDLFKKQMIEWTNARCEIIENEEKYLTELDNQIIF